MAFGPLHIYADGEFYAALPWALDPGWHESDTRPNPVGPRWTQLGPPRHLLDVTKRRLVT